VAASVMDPRCVFLAVVVMVIKDGRVCDLVRLVSSARTNSTLPTTYPIFNL
jgi:hypothetical protein